VLRSSGHAVNTEGVVGSFGLLDYFDITDPLRPQRKGPTLEADGPIMNGAVSDDGSFVAVAILSPDRLHKRIVALQHMGAALSHPRMVDPATVSEALQFEGRFLFLGIQRSPAPVFVELSTTESVSVYELGESRGRGR